MPPLSLYAESPAGLQREQNWRDQFYLSAEQANRAAYDTAVARSMAAQQNQDAFDENARRADQSLGLNLWRYRVSDQDRERAMGRELAANAEDIRRFDLGYDLKDRELKAGTELARQQRSDYINQQDSRGKLARERLLYPEVFNLAESGAPIDFSKYGGLSDETKALLAETNQRSRQLVLKDYAETQATADWLNAKKSAFAKSTPENRLVDPKDRELYSELTSPKSPVFGKLGVTVDGSFYAKNKPTWYTETKLPTETANNSSPVNLGLFRSDESTPMTLVPPTVPAQFMAGVTPSPFPRVTGTATGGDEVVRRVASTGRLAVFDANTKQFLRYAD